MFVCLCVEEYKRRDDSGVFGLDLILVVLTVKMIEEEIKSGVY